MQQDKEQQAGLCNVYSHSRKVSTLFAGEKDNTDIVNGVILLYIQRVSLFEMRSVIR